eukprot:11196089-Lingulodinium_polyedra.AAC.1
MVAAGPRSRPSPRHPRQCPLPRRASPARLSAGVLSRRSQAPEAPTCGSQSSAGGAPRRLGIPGTCRVPWLAAGQSRPGAA